MIIFGKIYITGRWWSSLAGKRYLTERWWSSLAGKIFNWKMTIIFGWKKRYLTRIWWWPLAGQRYLTGRWQLSLSGNVIYAKEDDLAERCILWNKKSDFYYQNAIGANNTNEGRPIQILYRLHENSWSIPTQRFSWNQERCDLHGKDNLVTCSIYLEKQFYGQNYSSSPSVIINKEVIP